MNRLSEQQNLALGVLSGGIEVSLLHWMNTLKSFAQQRLVRRSPWAVCVHRQLFGLLAALPAVRLPEASD